VRIRFTLFKYKAKEQRLNVGSVNVFLRLTGFFYPITTLYILAVKSNALHVMHQQRAECGHVGQMQNTSSEHQSETMSCKKEGIN